MDDDPTSPDAPQLVALPPPGGTLGRVILAVSLGLLGLLQVAIGIQADRTPTVVTGAIILVVAVSLGRRVQDGVHLGPGGVSIPGWPRGADVPWSRVERLVIQPLPFGLTRVRMARTDASAGAPPKALATLPPRPAARLLPQVEALAAANDVTVTTLERGQRP